MMYSNNRKKVKKVSVKTAIYDKIITTINPILEDNMALFYDLCKHGKWHKIQNGNRAGKSQGGLLPIIAY